MMMIDDDATDDDDDDDDVNHLLCNLKFLFKFLLMLFGFDCSIFLEFECLLLI